MGSGIGLCFARAGSAVVPTARRTRTLEAARARIDQSLEALDRASALKGTTRAAVKTRIATTTNLEQAVDGVEPLVESVVEDLAVKQDCLTGRSAPRLRAPACTGSIHPSSSRSWRSCRVHTRPRRSGATDRLGERSANGRCTWRRDIAGFVANRIQYAVFREAFALVEAGVCIRSPRAGGSTTAVAGRGSPHAHVVGPRGAIRTRRDRRRGSPRRSRRAPAADAPRKRSRSSVPRSLRPRSCWAPSTSTA